MQHAPPSGSGTREKEPAQSTPCANGCGARVPGIDVMRTCRGCRVAGAPAYITEALDRERAAREAAHPAPLDWLSHLPKL